MSDQEFVIELDDDSEGHAVRRAIVEPEERDWLEERLRQDTGKTSFRLLPDDSDDTEGHGATITVRALLADDDDTEGHAIAIHFPSRNEADAFRRRLLVTGVLVGTVALGAAGGVGLAAMQSGDEAGSAGAVQSSVTGSDWTQVERPAAAGSATIGSDWTQVERPGSATTNSDDDSGELRSVGGPTPR